MVQLHRPSLSVMTLNYISFYFYLSLVIMTGLLYYMDEVKIKWFNIDGKHCLLEWHP